MGRNAHANYIEAALAVLQELGGGPISTKTLVAAAQERGLVGDGKWVYHNFSRKVRDSDLFNTSIRGQISLVQNMEPVAETEVGEASVVVEEAPTPETQEQTEQASWPGPTLGQS
jgi:hypothetical protein